MCLSLKGGLLLLLSNLLLFTVSSAQVFSGRVIDEANEPLPGVQVVLDGTGIGTVTDNNGEFRFEELAKRRYRVTFRFVGFRSAVFAVDLRDGSTELLVALHEDTIEIDGVTITAEGQRQVELSYAPLSVSTLDAADLSDIRGQSLGETLAHLPGITTLTTGPTIAKPVIRGLHSDRLVILNAGVRQEGQQWGGEHAPEIDPFAPERIEVIRGASGVEYGIGAIGGVIRIEPRELPNEPGHGGQILFNGFSNSLQGSGSLHVEGGPAAVPGLGWRVQGSIRRAGDADTPDYALSNTAFRELNGSAAAGYHKDRWGLEAYASQFFTELGIYRGAHINSLEGLLAAIESDEPPIDEDFSYHIDTPKQVVSHSVASVKAHREGISGSIIELQYGVQRNHREEFDAHRIGGRDPSERPAFDLTLVTQSVDAKYRTAPRKRIFGVFGVSGMSQGNENNRVGYLIPNFRALTGGVFARGVLSRGDATVEAGTRFDYRWFKAHPRESGNTGDFETLTSAYSSISGVVGTIWQFHRAWSISSNIGSAWRPPNMSELYSYGLHHGTAQFEIGNRNLNAERSINADVTLRHVSGPANLQASAYVNMMYDFIHLFPLPDPTVTVRGVFPTFRYQQSDARLIGMDALAEYRFTPYLSAGASAGLVRADDLDNDVPLINMPADRIHLHAVIEYPQSGRFSRNEMEFGARLVRQQKRFPEGVDYADPPKGYQLFEIDFRTQVRTGDTHVDVSLSINNVFNTSYRDYLSRFRYFVDEPGRTFVLRLRLPLGTYVG